MGSLAGPPLLPSDSSSSKLNRFNVALIPLLLPIPRPPRCGASSLRRRLLPLASIPLRLPLPELLLCLRRRVLACHASPSAVASPSSPSPSSLYDVLGVPLTANGLEIKAAYRRLALECHPDVVAASRRGVSADEFMRVHAASATLSDPGKHAEYDRELTAHNRRQSVASPRSYTRSTSYPSYGRRTWRLTRAGSGRRLKSELLEFTLNKEIHPLQGKISSNFIKNHDHG